MRLCLLFIALRFAVAGSCEMLRYHLQAPQNGRERTIIMIELRNLYLRY